MAEIYGMDVIEFLKEQKKIYESKRNTLNEKNKLEIDKYYVGL